MHALGLCFHYAYRFTNEKSLATHRDQEHSRNGAVKKPTAPAVKVVKPPSEGEVKATCSECNKTFRRHFNMRIHIDRVY